MKKSLITLGLIFSVVSIIAQSFNGSIEFRYSTQKDTTMNIYLVKDNLVKLDQYGKKGGTVEGGFIFDLKAGEIKFVNPKRKLWGLQKSETPQIIRGKCRLGNANKENPRRSYSREDKPSRSEGFRSKDKREKPNFRESRETRNAPYRPYKKEERSERPANSEIREGKKQRTFKPRPGRSSSEQDRKFSGADRGEFKRRGERGQKPSFRETTSPEKRFKRNDFVGGKGFETPRFSKDQKQKRPAKPKESLSADGLIRLNKYLSNAGVASRRDADDLISSGAVKVNGIVVDQLGYKIKPTDKVTYGDQAVKGERKVYLLLNKPKDYITTMDDPQERRTVMQLISGACKERVYPVGRLDRNTTGLLLFTNDGELAAKLTHPKHGIKKVYHVSLNKGLKADDFKAIIDGVELEDGLVKADDLAFVGEGKKEIGIEIHSGRNRVVRRLFEHLGYDVIKLDRVAFAGLSKKELPRGKHRFLTAKEISFLQMIG